ncbi:hypothetical protein [Phenylobacterium sp.]|uniref:hypothetical protein n=1 Tax=Phenylobacterium sp. TaxID=1871053 RepID=UPI00391D5F9B
MEVLPNVLNKAREGRSALRQLDSLRKANCLYPEDWQRLMRKAREGFDAILGPDPGQPGTPTEPSLHLVKGGRP